MKINSILNRVLRIVDNIILKAEVYVLSCGIIIMALNSIANVFGRYVFSHSLYFSEELNVFLMIIITFIGLGYVTRKGRHIRMSAIYDLLSYRHKKILMIFIAAVTAITMFTLAWFSYEYVAKIASRGRVTPALQVPIYLTYLWVIIGFVLAGIQYLLVIVKNLTTESDDVYISYTEIDSYDDPELSGIKSAMSQQLETESSNGEKQ